MTDVSRNGGLMADPEYKELGYQLWELQRKAAEHELALMEQIRRLQAANIELAERNFQSQIDRVNSREQAYVDTVLGENRQLNGQVAELTSLVASQTEKASEVDLRWKSVVEEAEARHADAIKAVRESLEKERALLAGELRDLIAHLHAVDERRAAQDADRDAELKTNRMRIAELESFLKDANAQLKDAKESQNGLYKLLELTREKLKLRDDYIKKLESDTDVKSTLIELVELLEGRKESLSDLEQHSGLDLPERIDTIRASDLFDAAWYMAKYGDRLGDGEDPIEHYVREGHRLGFSPSYSFDGTRYVAEYGDVAASGDNPLYHYIKYGRDEGRAIWSLGT